VSPDSRWLITGSLDKTVRVWEITADQGTRKPLVLAGHEEAVNEIIISPDSHWLLTRSIDDVALLWELPSFDQCPACRPWNGDKIPPGVKKPGNRYRIARTDPTSSLWTDRLSRFETPAPVEPTQVRNVTPASPTTTAPPGLRIPTPYTPSGPSEVSQQSSTSGGAATTAPGGTPHTYGDNRTGPISPSAPPATAPTSPTGPTGPVTTPPPDSSILPVPDGSGTIPPLTPSSGGEKLPSLSGSNSPAVPTAEKYHPSTGNSVTPAPPGNSVTPALPTAPSSVTPPSDLNVPPLKPPTLVVGIPEQLSVTVQNRNIVEVGRVQEFLVEVANNGDAAENDIVVTAYLPAGSSLVSEGTGGPDPSVTFQQHSGIVRFTPVSELPAKKVMNYRINVTASQPGAITLRAEATSRAQSQPTGGSTTVDVLPTPLGPPPQDKPPPKIDVPDKAHHGDVNLGYRPWPQGGTEFIIQIGSDTLGTLQSDDPISIDVPPDVAQWSRPSHFTLRIGNEPMPHVLPASPSLSPPHDPSREPIRTPPPKGVPVTTPDVTPAPTPSSPAPTGSGTGTPALPSPTAPPARSEKAPLRRAPSNAPPGYFPPDGGMKYYGNVQRLQSNWA